MTARARRVATRLFAGALLAGAAAFAVSSVAPPADAPDDAVAELDLERARRLLERAPADSPVTGLVRARLTLYTGACDTAAAQLSSPVLAETREGQNLREVAEACAGATAAAFVVEDERRGIVLRLQDDADRALAPFLFDVVEKSEASIGEALGVTLPRPLRIDLVRDLFSLSAVSGLPLSAAETTGTLAVARWGRVIMLSPRATPDGYPWQDTLAHELAHLFLTRATRDHAPLWLQEGIAKREEARWRPARPFDDPAWADATARRALEAGRSVGLDRLGPSIAMLPTPEAASTAYAEVASFMKHWLEVNGQPALRLLFLDMKGLGRAGAESALRSVSGYGLGDWNRLWQRALLDVPPRDPRAQRTALPPLKDPRALARHVRLGDLLFERGALRQALAEYEAAVKVGPHEPAVRFRSARAALALGAKGALEERLGALEELRGPHGGWMALEGRRLREAGREQDAAPMLEHALGLDPLSEAPACEGSLRAPEESTPAGHREPASPERKALCSAVRASTSAD